MRSGFRRWDVSLAETGAHPSAGATIPFMNVGVPVRVHDIDGDDLGIAHMPWPISPGDVLEFGGDGPIAPLWFVNLVETGRLHPVAALVKAAPLAAVGTRRESD